MAAQERRTLRRPATVAWSGVRNSIYSAASMGVRLMTVDPQYDAYQYYVDEPQHYESRLPGRERAREPSWPAGPFSDTAYPADEKQRSEDPFADPPPPVAPQPSSDAEEPYHVFNKSQKWVLIVIIGVAGLFSGLSSNIYFPALDQIARVCCSRHLLSRKCTYEQPWART